MQNPVDLQDIKNLTMEYAERVDFRGKAVFLAKLRAIPSSATEPFGDFEIDRVKHELRFAILGDRESLRVKVVFSEEFKSVIRIESYEGK